MFGTSRLVGALLITVVVIATACQSSQTSSPAAETQGANNAEVVQLAGGSYRNISAVELNTMLGRKDFFLVDVHVPHEGYLAKTDARIAYDRIDQHLGDLPGDKEARIVLYCRSGRMSEIAAEKLVRLGYRDVWNLKEGMVGWQDAGYALEAN